MAHKTATRGRLLAAAFLAGTFAALPLGKAALAGSFMVDPVNINLAADAATASITIQNNDPTPLSVRISTFAWTQANGEDVYTPTKDVITTPPIVTIPANGKQIIRVGLRKRDTSVEKTYRVIVDEIPAKTKDDKATIQVALRLNLPLYALPKGGGKPELRWSAWRQADGQVVLEAKNSGKLHGQVLEVDAVGSDGKKINLTKNMGVVLPGSARQWKLGKRGDVIAGASYRFVVKSPHGEGQQNVVVEKR